MPANSTTTSTTNTSSENLPATIAKCTDKLITARIKSAPYDKTYAGIISEILFEPGTKITDANFGKYKVRYNNIEKTFKLNDGLVHAIGERVTVYVPENNPNRMYAEPAVKRIIPYKIVYVDSPESEDNQKYYENEDKEKDRLKEEEKLRNEAEKNDAEYKAPEFVTFIEYRKVKTNSKEYEIESKYKLKVYDKGASDEEVVAMLCPDGSEIQFVNW